MFEYTLDGAEAAEKWLKESDNWDVYLRGGSLDGTTMVYLANSLYYELTPE